MDPVAAIAGAVGSVSDLVGGLVFSEEERAALDLGWGELDVRRDEAEAAVEVAEAQSRAALFAGAMDSGRARTYTLGAVVAIAIAAGAYMTTKGGTT